jgi:hypothetical protein
VRLKWAHVCTGAREDDGRWTIVGPFQSLPLKPELGGRFHHADFVAMLEADQNEAREDQTASLDLIRGDDEVVFGEDDIPVVWRPIAPGYPSLANVHRAINMWPLTRTGRYRIQLSVDGEVKGSSLDFFALPASGELKIPPRLGVRRRGVRLAFVHFARDAGAPNGIPFFQEIEEYRLIAGSGTHLVSGWVVGAITGGTEDPRHGRCSVQLRLPDGTTAGTSPEHLIQFQGPGKGHEIGALFWVEHPPVSLPPADYSFAVLLDGKEVGSLEYPVIAGV